ncbi:hypothetical protein N431DRAFT_478669 [Stipitochalara longipes BDJ]|nr:hypothetical protein N431DRAFT_478669 [Stipitochalara longipes BDJ]
MVDPNNPPSPTVSLQTLHRPEGLQNEGSSFSRDQQEYSQSYRVSALMAKPVIQNDPSRDKLLDAADHRYGDNPDRLGSKAKPKNRFGVYLISILASSAVVLIAGLSFLLFLWLAPATNHQWRSIILAGWATRSVTLTALAIRWATATQATATISMLAAIQLEKGGTAFYNVAALSIARYKNSGPAMSLPIFFDKIAVRQQFLLPAFAMLLACTTLVLQFTSTILLGDMQLGPVLGTSKTGLAMMASQNRQLGSGFFSSNYWSTTPTAFQAFAEYTEPPFNGSDISDTGVAIRGFLPLSTESVRSSLQNYSGVAALFDTRVACLQPLSSNIQVKGGDESDVGNGGSLTITGSAVVGNAMPDLINPRSNTTFNCTFPLEAKDPGQPAFLICGVGGPPNGKTDGGEIEIKGLAGGLIPRLDSSSESALSHGSAYLVVNYTNVLYSAHTLSGNWTLSSSLGRGPWLDLSYTVTAVDTSNTSVIDMAVSMCFDALPYAPADDYSIPQDYKIGARSTVNRTEPALGSVTEDGKFSTDQLQNQLGATIPRNSTISRGVMDLQIEPMLNFVDSMRTGQNNTPGNPYVVDAGEGPKDFVSSLVWNQFLSFENNAGRQLLAVACTNCTRNVAGPVSFSTGNRILDMNIVQATLFENILTDTGDPSLALQAQLTSLLRMAYYDWVPLFDWNSTQTTTSFVDRQLPASQTGLWIIVGFMAAHSIMVTCVLVWFCRSTKFTLLDNAWQVVAQIHSSETEQLLTDRSISIATDTQVQAKIQQAGQSHLRLRLRRVDDSGRVELRS